MNRMLIVLSIVAAVAVGYSVGSQLQSVDVAPSPRSATATPLATVYPEHFLEPPSAADWGKHFDDVVAATHRLAGSEPSLARFAKAAATLVSRMRSGPLHPNEWAPYLNDGIYQCNKRAWLMASIVRAFDPGCRLRRVGMASIPEQGSHSALEVFLDDQQSWGYFDPSSGTFFTDNGRLDGRVLSMAEIFASPDVVDAPGPLAPVLDRPDVPPYELDLGDNLARVARPQPGFAPSNFPLRKIVEEASAYGAYLAGHPIVNPVEFDAQRDAVRDGIDVAADGTIRNRLSAYRGADGRPVSWLDRVGIHGSGLNIVPNYTITGLEPWAEYTLTLTFTYHRAGFEITPLCTDGCRLAERIPVFSLAEGTSPGLTVYTLRFVATDTTATILLLHNGDEAGEKARIGRIEITRPAPPLAAER